MTLKRFRVTAKGEISLRPGKLTSGIHRLNGQHCGSRRANGNVVRAGLDPCPLPMNRAFREPLVTMTRGGRSKVARN